MKPPIDDKSSVERWRLRPDIEWIAQPNQSKWVARDPLTGGYFYFSEIEYAAAQLISAGNLVDVVIKNLRRRFPENDFSPTWLGSFVSRLNAAHLLSPTSPEVVQSLTKLRHRSAVQSVLQILAMPLSVRVPLFNPARLLANMQGLARLLFHPITCLCVVACSAILAALVIGQVLESDTPLFRNLASIQGDRWLLLLASYVVVKSFHEFGHSLACARFRVDCQEVGLIFLFFTPCFYCDTTDSWKLSSKWQRAAIAAAGMYFELMFASLAALVWLSTRDGTLHTIASSVMIVCSVGTLLINANPFLRYDGYYIASDLWGVPNLAEQSRDALWSLFVSALSGRQIESSHLDANIWSLGAFAIASALYRAFLAVTILWIAWSSLVPYGLGFIAINIMLVYLAGMLLMFSRIAKSVYREMMLGGMLRFSRVVFVFTAMIVGVAFLLEVPIATFVAARAVSDFSDKVPLFAPATAELNTIASTSAMHRADVRLAEFSAPDKLLALEILRGEIVAAKQKLKQLEARSAIDETVAFEIPTTREVVADLQKKESLLLSDVNALTISSQAEGRLIVGDYRLPPPLAFPSDEQLDLSPTAEGNIGCTVERGALVAWYTTEQKPVLTAIVAQEDVRLLSIGMEAKCRWDSDFGIIETGRVIRISPEPITQTPSELHGDAYLISQRGLSGRLVPESPHYEVTIELPSSAMQHLKGSVASVRFKIASRTLFESAVRYIRLSFKPVY